MNHPLDRYKSVADAVAALFAPDVEVVIHEIQTDTVFYIANPVSGRKPGDISLLELDGQDLDVEGGVIGPYEKAGEKGQRVRAATAVLRDGTGKAMGLMCINQDHSVYEPALDLLQRLVRPPRAQQHPEILFQNDWRDQIKLEVRAFFECRSGRPERLTPAERKTLIAGLDEKGLFFAKKSIEQVAGMIGVSRATAYNDLKAARQGMKKPI